MSEKCKACNGAGIVEMDFRPWLYSPNDTCPECKGVGKLLQRKGEKK